MKCDIYLDCHSFATEKKGITSNFKASRTRFDIFGTQNVKIPCIGFIPRRGGCNDSRLSFSPRKKTMSLLLPESRLTDGRYTKIGSGGVSLSCQNEVARTTIFLFRTKMAVGLPPLSNVSFISSQTRKPFLSLYSDNEAQSSCQISPSACLLDREPCRHVASCWN